MLMTAFWIQAILGVIISLIMANKYDIRIALLCIPASIGMAIANCVIIVMTKAIIHVFPFIGFIFYLLVIAHHIWLVKQVQAFEPMRMISVVMLIALIIFGVL